MRRPLGPSFKHDRPDSASVQFSGQPHANRAAADNDHVMLTQLQSSTLSASGIGATARTRKVRVGLFVSIFA
jgi:hypothetical protein